MSRVIPNNLREKQGASQYPMESPTEPRAAITGFRSLPRRTLPGKFRKDLVQRGFCRR